MQFLLRSVLSQLAKGKKDFQICQETLRKLKQVKKEVFLSFLPWKTIGKIKARACSASGIDTDGLIELDRGNIEKTINLFRTWFSYLWQSFSRKEKEKRL